MCAPKGESGSQALLAGIVETGDKNCYVSQHHALFCEEILGKIDAELSSFSEQGSARILSDRLKALITLEQVNTSVKTSMARL